jgi:hypothetical protein
VRVPLGHLNSLMTQNVSEHVEVAAAPHYPMAGKGVPKIARRRAALYGRMGNRADRLVASVTYVRSAFAPIAYRLRSLDIKAQLRFRQEVPLC